MEEGRLKKKELSPKSSNRGATDWKRKNAEGRGRLRGGRLGQKNTAQKGKKT